ncbi:hypothetical protein [Pseudomonas xionganensis]|uniref:DUF1631 family protein n=1 Tax=Pseudomonas xionganensis TaxID=2654845 RepID=A0A6I4KTI6_9PSED|nr:hypothetical protein [Pseudomonas xionganensis]MVW75930.1 DUF1631 family protein [Pseudomonas xionganensis]
MPGGFHASACLEALFDATQTALKEQRLQARSNVEVQGCEEFLRLCIAHRGRVVAQTISAILDLLPVGITPQATAPSSESEWQLVDDAEVEEMLEARRLVRQLREQLGTLEWRSCARLNATTGAHARDRESPLSLEFMIRCLQARLHLREQLPVVREHFYAVAARELAVVLQAYFKQLDTVFAEFEIEPRVEPDVHPLLQRQRERRAALKPDAPYQAIQQLRAVEGGNGQPGSISEPNAGRALAAQQCASPGLVSRATAAAARSERPGAVAATER